MSCSITSRGLLMPPDQKSSHTESIFDLSSPVIVTAFPLPVRSQCYAADGLLRRLQLGLLVGFSFAQRLTISTADVDGRTVCRVNVPAATDRIGSRRKGRRPLIFLPESVAAGCEAIV